MKLHGFKASLVLFFALIVSIPSVLACRPENSHDDAIPPNESSLPANIQRTYTLDTDFDEGELIGLEHESVHDQLQLSEEQEILPFIWVPNREGSVSKIDTITGKELGRYWTSPFPRTDSGDPSRTTVDLEGNCWVGNRRAGTIIKIGLFETGNWIDRNGDGICQTSFDLNDDGNISPDEMLSWGQDECVLMEVSLIPGYEGVFVPGTFNGTYDRNYYGTAPRGLAVDANNNLWASTYLHQNFFYIDGETGTILREEDFSNLNHVSYGAVIDRYGMIWSSGVGTNSLMKMDPTLTPATFSIMTFPYIVYGIGLDYDDHIYITHYGSDRMSRVNITTMALDRTIVDSELYLARGVVATSDNHIWVAESGRTKVVEFDENMIRVNIYEVGITPTGVAVDSEGKVWACNLGDNYISRIDPAMVTVDLKKEIINSMGHYSYSDMTGMVVRSITTKIGTWTVIHDTMIENAHWGKISWTCDEPVGTQVVVRVRSSNDQITWSEWETAINENMLTATPEGRYLQIEATLRIYTGDETPILYDLTVQLAMLPMKIDIKPWNPWNVINPNSKGIIEVAIIDDGTFDLHEINFEEVYFGPNHAEPIHWKYFHHHHHQNGIIFYFKMEETGISKGDTTAELTAMLTNGILLIGSDEISTVPRKYYGYK